MDWLLFAFGSAVFAGLTAVLSKIGVRDTDSDLATAVVLVFSWIMVFLTGTAGSIGAISPETCLFLVLSGVATGASWLFYFRALQLGDVNKVAPIDKSSTILTMLLAALILGEGLGAMKILCMALIGTGTLMMIGRGGENGEQQMACGCPFIGCICQPDRHSGKNWNTGRGVQSGNSHPHLCGAGNGLAFGVPSGKAEASGKDCAKELVFPHYFGVCHRRFLAVLLQGPAGRACQYRGSH